MQFAVTLYNHIGTYLGIIYLPKLVLIIYHIVTAKTHIRQCGECE